MANDTIKGFQTTSGQKQYDYYSLANRPEIAELDENGKVPSSQLPSYVDSVNGKTGAVELSASDIGAAPDGYGLGLNASSYDEVLSINTNPHKNGWYPQIVEGEYPWGEDYGEGLVVHVSNYYGENTHHTYYASNGNVLWRHCNYGTWQPYEWVNPPMTLGVEYRTTERWNGKAVYTKLVNIGLAYEEPSSISISGAKQVVRYVLHDVTNNRPYDCVRYPNLQISMNESGGSYHFTIYRESTVDSSVQWNVQLWYTK